MSICRVTSFVTASFKGIWPCRYILKKSSQAEILTSKSDDRVRTMNFWKYFYRSINFCETLEDLSCWSKKCVKERKIWAFVSNWSFTLALFYWSSWRTLSRTVFKSEFFDVLYSSIYYSIISGNLSQINVEPSKAISNISLSYPSWFWSLSVKLS